MKGDEKYRRLVYEQDIKLLLAIKSENKPEKFIQRFENLTTEVEFYRDDDTALLAGWVYLDTGDTAGATRWFRKVADWNPENEQAVEGLAVSALIEKRYKAARSFAEQLPDSHESKIKIRRDAILGIAVETYEDQNYTETLQLLNEAGNLEDLPRYAQLLAAWSMLQSGQHNNALGLFRTIHQQHPDEESAQGVFNAMIKVMELDELDCSPEDTMLKPLFQDYCADRYFEQKRFLIAKELAPDRYGSAGGIGTPRIATYYTYRDKTGTPGLSKLEDQVISLEAVWPVSSRSETRFWLHYHYLDDDNFGQEARDILAQGLLTGALGITSNNPDFSDLTRTSADSLEISGAGRPVKVWEPHVSWRYESTLDLEADIGISALTGETSPKIIGHLSLSDRGHWGSYQLKGYARPIRESLLSYTGWRLDRFLPRTSFNGTKWGGVRSSGIRLDGYYSLGNQWGLGGNIGGEYIDGENVKENTHGFVLLGINRNLNLDEFEYFAVGISTSYDHYEYNLSQFTPGHGGYFSPQSFLQYKLNLDFLTLENRKVMLKGHLDGGRVYKDEESTPIIPISGFEGFGQYQGDREWGWSYTVEVDGAIQLSDHFQLGTALSYRSAPQYDEFAGTFFIRYLFDARKTVLSSDLAGRLLDVIR